VGAKASSHRVKISVTVAPELVRAVDTFLEGHPELDRSKVMDRALTLWVAEQQDEAMAAQFLGPLSAAEEDELSRWQETRRAAAERLFRSPS
jgi:metal-responsive CopG/Arc/MetJ family transcriptional regulator